MLRGRNPARTMRDELELIRAASAGDREAFETLVRLKRERVVRTAFQVTGEMEDALDVAQGVFLKVWNGLGQFDPNRRFDTWLHRITVNAAIDMLRQREPRGTLQPLPDDPSNLAAAGQTGLEESIDLARLRKIFRHLADGLAPKQRTAFVLREIEGLGTAEVASVMGVAESTVRNHLLQARRILRERMIRDFPGWLPRGRSGGEGDPS